MTPWCLPKATDTDSLPVHVFCYQSSAGSILRKPHFRPGLSYRAVLVTRSDITWKVLAMQKILGPTSCESVCSWEAPQVILTHITGWQALDLMSNTEPQNQASKNSSVVKCSLLDLKCYLTCLIPISDDKRKKNAQET